MLIKVAAAIAVATSCWFALPAVTAQVSSPTSKSSARCTITGTAGNDVLIGTSGPDVICGLGGNDVLIGGGGDDVLIGGRGDDVLIGGRGDDVLIGGRGSDRLVGGRGSDRLVGGRGDDVLIGGRGRDVLIGGRGSDRLVGGRGDDVLIGGRGRDVLIGGRGSDRLVGGRGNDVLRAKDGQAYRDRLSCGPGRDRAVADAPDRVRRDCEAVDQPRPPTVITGTDVSGPTAPVLETTAGTTAYTEDDPATVVDPGITLTDADADGVITRATVEIGSGFASGQDVLALAGTHPGITAEYAAGTLTLSGRASPSAYRAALREVTYLNASQAPSTAVRSVTFEVTDDAALTDAATRRLSVTAVNDAPVTTVPGAQEVVEDETLVFGAGEDNAILVADVDAVDDDVQVTLTVAHGTVMLGGIADVAVSGDGTAHVTLTGPVTAVNASLEGMTYRPELDYHGADAIEIEISDLGHTGVGGALTDAAKVDVTVTAVNDAPSFAKGPDQNQVDNNDGDGQPVAYTVDPWATEISAGPGEDDQSLTFEVVADDESLFDVPPAVSPEGVLTFTPDPNEVGTANVTVRLIDDGGTDHGGVDASAEQTFVIETVEPGPAIRSISPSPLVPGASATLTGRMFSPTPAQNTVTIGGAAATVTGATDTSLTVTVPCVASGADVAVQATVSGVETNTVNHPLQVPQRDLDVGEAAIVTDVSEVGCNELASADGPARYVIAVYDAGTSPTTSSGFQLSADSTGGSAGSGGRGSLTLDGPGEDALADHVHAERGVAELDSPDGGDAHLDLLERNREQYEVLREKFGTAGVPRRGGLHDSTAEDLPMSRTIRIPNINAGNYCNSYYLANVTRVYAAGKLVIYEDDATPNALKAANNATMADYYARIGDQFNTDMEPLVRSNFGDILRRDAVTDNNGVVVAVSTPRLNDTFPGVSGFVVSCDQFPNDDTNAPGVGGPYVGSDSNGASNFGEFFYLHQPTVNASGYDSGNTPDNWYRTVRSTVIHESKHIASMAARVANAAPAYEASWLEEATARHAEELWAREVVYDLPWKGNSGYGSSDSPVNLYCDARPAGRPECEANPRGPAAIMQRHFASLYTLRFGQNGRLLSPFGATPSDNASYFYAVGWSLIRYAIDHHGVSEADFLTALTQSTDSGATNLAQRTGVTTDRLLGGWALALAVDDYPGLTDPSPETQMPTWDLRSIFAGLNEDFPGIYSLAYPNQPTNLSFGSFGPTNVTTLYGGGVLWYQMSGTQTKPQLLRLLGNGGTALGNTVRLAVARVQ